MIEKIVALVNDTIDRQNAIVSSWLNIALKSSLSARPDALNLFRPTFLDQSMTFRHFLCEGYSINDNLQKKPCFEKKKKDFSDVSNSIDQVKYVCPLKYLCLR